MAHAYLQTGAVRCSKGVESIPWVGLTLHPVWLSAREGRSAFPARAALNQVAGRFLTGFYVTVAHWVDWASGIVADWPDDVREAPFDVAAAEEGVRLAESITSLDQGWHSRR